MKNPYFTSYFPLFSIILFSTSLAISTVLYVIEFIKLFGIYNGMLEFFSPNGIRLALFIVFALIYFMIFSALKLIANTITELSLLFFSNDREGISLKKIRMGSTFYVIAGGISLISVQSYVGILIILLIATLGYFIFIVYQFSSMLTSLSLIGLVLFHIVIWFTFVIGILYLLVRLYNSVMASLPL